MHSWVRYSVAVYLGLLMAGSIMASSSMNAGGDGGRGGFDAPRLIPSSPSQSPAPRLPEPGAGAPDRGAAAKTARLDT